MLPKEEALGETVHGSLSVTADGAMIGVTGSGFLSSADVAAHFREVRRIAAAARRHHVRLKILIDLRASAVQTREITEQIASESRTIWSPTDRVAMVLRPGLAKMQINRLVDARDYGFFDDIHAARHWLDRE